MANYVSAVAPQYQSASPIRTVLAPVMPEAHVPQQYVQQVDPYLKPQGYTPLQTSAQHLTIPQAMATPYPKYVGSPNISNLNSYADHTVNTTGTRILREHRYKKNKAIVKRQRPGCCGIFNAYCCRGGVCDYPSGPAACLNCMGCCDRQKTIIRRVDAHLSEEELHGLQYTPRGCCGCDKH